MARAAGPPELLSTWASDVVATSARLHADVNPNGFSTSYHFDYIKASAYEANIGGGKDGFLGATKAPPGSDPTAGSGTTPIPLSQQITGLSPETSYRYRVVAKNNGGTETSQPLSITTQSTAGGATLADGRAWEMVSPVDKNGGSVAAPGALAGGGLLQAADQGAGATFSSAASFGPGAKGAPNGSQYVSHRTGSGWTTDNVTIPMLSGSYPGGPVGVPYQLFSSDLARALLLDPRRCEEGEPCPRSYSLREAGAFTTSPQEPDLRFAGASPDLRHRVLSTCAALTPDATEVPAGDGCDPAATNLYEWNGGQLRLINLLPGESQGTPGANLAEAATAVSTDASRVYFTQGGDLYLREGAQTEQVDETVGGGVLLHATPDGSLAFFIKGGSLYRYDADADASTAVALGSAVEGPLHATADGNHIAFASTAPLTEFDSMDQETSEPDAQVYLYDIASDTLTCVSCNPTGARPIGPSSIPGARPNGTVPGSFGGYKPRALLDGGKRLFFDSADALVLSDTNKAPDAYEWEAEGTGSCTRAGGCLSLLSSGKGEGGASFVDASTDGADAFFLTERSLVGTDPGSIDLYDARIGGGFPEPFDPIPCEGDACQVLPSEPSDPPLNTLVKGPGNAAVRYRKINRRRHHEKHRHEHRHRGAHHHGKQGDKHRRGRR